jgi:thymidine kinase
MKNIYNKVIIDATILISTVAVWLTTEKTLGMVVLMASLKSLLFRKCSICSWFAKQKVEIFKPALDTRYSEEDVVSHDQNSIRSTPIESSGSILLLASDIDVVGIDEAQFLDNGLVEVCNELANRGVRVIVAGLDMDFKGVPFGPIPALCAIADEVTKVHAICVKCGSVAYVSHRLVNNDKRVLLGEKDEYEPLCRECYQKAILNEKL